MVVDKKSFRVHAQLQTLQLRISGPDLRVFVLSSHQHFSIARLYHATMKPTIALAALVGVQGISGLSVPSNVRSFYNRVKPTTCTGTEKLKGGFYDQEGGSARTYRR